MVVLVSVIVIVLACAVMFMLGGDGGGGNAGYHTGKVEDDVVGESGVHNSVHIEMTDESELPDATKPIKETNESGDTLITFDGDSIDIKGVGVAVSGDTVLIGQAGVYRLTGTLSDGRIVINAKGEEIVLVLDGVNVTCSYSSPLYIYKAADVTLLLNGTTENVFTDGESYDYGAEYSNAGEGEPDACIFSKADLVIRGSGSLKVNGNYNSGIIGKDTLKISNTTVLVDAKNNGINGKDSLTVENSTVKVTAGGDALRSTQENDASLGWAQFTDSNIYLTSKDGDGIQTERGITVNDCSISITCGENGAQSAPSESSLKGMKSNQGYITVNGGSFVINTYDDAFHSAGDITVNGGEISVSTGDDAFHSDSNIYVTGGTLKIPDCHEGLEGALIEVSGGEVYIVADDDGINASGGNDASAEDIFRGMFESDGSHLEISGGLVYINSMGDGIDSNGDINLSGGTLIVSGPISSGDGAVDYNGSFRVDGGTLLAMGSAGMAQAPDALSVNAFSITFDSPVPAGTYICISGGGREYVFLTEKNTENVVFSAPGLEADTEYTVSTGGEYSGTVSYCIGEGGSYSGGSEVFRITLAEGLNTYGTVGIGGTRGGHMFGEVGGFGGGRGFGGRGMTEDERGEFRDENGMGGMQPPELPEGENGMQPPEPPEGGMP